MDYSIHAAKLLSALFAGLLAGGEIVIWLGVRRPITDLPTASHILVRQGLIKRLRILVPLLFGGAVLANGVAQFATAKGLDVVFRLGSAGSLAAFIMVALFGTVPINKAVLAWRPDAPPSGWKAMIRRWERLDTVRAILALLAFALSLPVAS